MEREEVGVVGVVGAAVGIVRRSPAGGDKVGAVEEPVHVLEAVVVMVHVMEERPQPVRKLRNIRLSPAKWTLLRGPSPGLIVYDADVSCIAGYGRLTCTEMLEQQH